MIFSSLSSRRQEILLVAIALLSMYMQANYTGPELHEVFSDISSVYPFPWFSVLLFFSSHPQSNDQGILRTLEVDGEMPYQLEKYPLFLSCAESLLLVLADLESSLYVQWWLARSAVAHHRCLLGNPSPTLCERVRANQTARRGHVRVISLTHTQTGEDEHEGGSVGDDSLSGGGRSLLPLHLRDGEGESLLPSSDGMWVWRRGHT